MKISFIITCPYYDMGIKSLGSKCLLSTKRKKIIEKQCYAIERFCGDEDHEVILVNSIEHIKTQKFIEKKLPQIKYVYIDSDNINYAGSFIKGLGLAKYPNVINIECGLVISSSSIKYLKTANTDISVGCITNKHKQNLDIELGCTIEQNNISNMFFGLEHKYIGIFYIGENVKHFILDNYDFDSNKNKFMFELVNNCISQGYTCEPSTFKGKDSHLVFNKKSLQQYIGLS